MDSAVATRLNKLSEINSFSREEPIMTFLSCVGGTGRGQKRSRRPRPQAGQCGLLAQVDRSYRLGHRRRQEQLRSGPESVPAGAQHRPSMKDEETVKGNGNWREMKVAFYFIVSLIAFGVHHVDSIRRRHEVRSGRARTATTLQVFRLYEPSFQSQVALQPLRQRLAAV